MNVAKGLRRIGLVLGAVYFVAALVIGLSMTFSPNRRTYLGDRPPTQEELKQWEAANAPMPDEYAQEIIAIENEGKKINVEIDRLESEVHKQWFETKEPLKSGAAIKFGESTWILRDIEQILKELDDQNAIAEYERLSSLRSELHFKADRKRAEIEHTLRESRGQYYRMPKEELYAPTYQHHWFPWEVYDFLIVVGAAIGGFIAIWFSPLLLYGIGKGFFVTLRGLVQWIKKGFDE